MLESTILLHPLKKEHLEVCVSSLCVRENASERARAREIASKRAKAKERAKKTAMCMNKVKEMIRPRKGDQARPARRG